MNKLYEKKEKIKFQGKEIEMNIIAEWDYDDIDPADCIAFDNPEEEEKYLKRFENGELHNIYIVISAWSNGVKGFDSLGACHITDCDFENDIQDIIKSHDMEQLAIDHWKQCVIDQYFVLSELYKK